MAFFAGIDYSMTCPSICIWDSSKDLTFSNTQVFFLKKEKKYDASYQNVHGFLTPAYTNDMERFDLVSEWAIKILTKFNVKKVCLEGYAMGASKGLIFNIAENTAILKYKMMKEGIEYITPPPTTVKKFFSGAGNAKKDKIHDTLLEQEGVDISAIVGVDKLKSPTSDVVDSYAMLKYMVKEG